MIFVTADSRSEESVVILSEHRERRISLNLGGILRSLRSLRM